MAQDILIATAYGLTTFFAGCAVTALYYRGQLMKGAEALGRLCSQRDGWHQTAIDLATEIQALRAQVQPRDPKTNKFVSKSKAPAQ